MIKFKLNDDGSMERVYEDKDGNIIHEGDFVIYPDGTQKEVYLTDNEELGTDATNPDWIRAGRAYACEYGIYPFNNAELETIKIVSSCKKEN